MTGPLATPESRSLIPTRRYFVLHRTTDGQKIVAERDTEHEARQLYDDIYCGHRCTWRDIQNRCKPPTMRDELREAFCGTA